MTDIHAVLTDSSNGWSADTKIQFPGEEGFAAATSRWAVYKPPTYAAAISPATEEDVVKAVRISGRADRKISSGDTMANAEVQKQVKLATRHNIRFLATGGRHGYSTAHGKLQNGLAMNLRQLNSIELDTAAETVTVGGGVTTGEVLDPLFEAGFDLRE